MGNGLQKLQDIGAQKIHENTHISREHIQALLHGNFDDLNKIQFLGFISILERDYGIKLDELTQKGVEYFEDKSTLEKRKNYKIIYIAVVILVFIIAVFYTISLPSNTINSQAVDNSMIDDAKSNIVVAQELNTTVEESNVSKEMPLFVEEPKAIEKSFKVIPNAKLWMGYVDMATNKKYQKIFKDALELNPDKEWLLSLGHGNVSFEVNGELKEFHSKKTMRFIYKDAELREITFKEFERLNKGSKW